MSDYPASGTYSLEDLDHWQRKGISLAVLGHPVRHSISPQMHNAALDQLSKAHSEYRDWRYFRFDIASEDIPKALPLFAKKGFLGLNLTVPHKEVALPLIEEINPQAARIGAVNTLKRVSDRWVGHNTDGYGLKQGLIESTGARFEKSDVVLLGAGGAARAAAVEILSNHAKSLTIVNRNQERLGKLASNLRSLANEHAIPLSTSAPDRLGEIPPKAIVVNATSLGLKEDDPSPLPDTWPLTGCVYYDMIYNPAQTKAMKQAKSLGADTANGLSMLIHQGAKALEIWTEREIDVSVMTQAADKALT